MRRAFGLWILAAVLGAAGPSLPLPPIPPSAGGDGLPPRIISSRAEPAPMPDLTMAPPAPAYEGGVHVTPELFRQGRADLGDGYLPGSTIAPYEDRNVPLTPGIELHIPTH